MNGNTKGFHPQRQKLACVQPPPHPPFQSTRHNLVKERKGSRRYSNQVMYLL